MIDPSTLPGAPALDGLDPPPRTTGEKQTARRAIEILLQLNAGFHLPTRAERDALLVGFAMRRQVLYGAAFDLVRTTSPITLDDPAAIAECLDALTVYEIKSTNKERTRADFRGYFFDLTTAELLIAQSLGARYRFAFVNALSREWLDLTLRIPT